MDHSTTFDSGRSLFERAADVYDFASVLRAPPAPEPEADSAPPEHESKAPPEEKAMPASEKSEPAPKSQAKPQPASQPEAKARTVPSPKPQARRPEPEAAPPVKTPAPQPAAPAPRPETPQPRAEAQVLEKKMPAAAQPQKTPEPSAQPAPARTASPAAKRSGPAKVDRKLLEEGGYLLPGGAVSGLAEEFRIVKRQLLLPAAKTEQPDAVRQRTILVCSAQPDDGKTFCAVNLALSLAGEKDLEVLLVDGDFPKPEILSILGIEGGRGLIDALADPSVDAEDLIIQTDVPGLSVLPAGRQLNNVPELLGSKRTQAVLAQLARNPRRIILFDSPPVLAASPASILAAHVGQILMVVRADRTTEADLREAVALLSGCDRVNLILNGTGFTANGRRFGSYYGLSQ